MGHGWADKSDQAQEWRWQGPQPAPDFAMMPGIIARDIMQHLTGAEFKVLYALLDDAYRGGRSYAVMSIRSIAERCGCARRTVIYALHKLRDARLIDVADLEVLGSNQPTMHRVLVTADRRYTERRASAKNAPPPSAKNAPQVVQKTTRSRVPSFLSINREREEGTHTRKRYTRGCEMCDCTPCQCGKEVAR